MKRLSLTLTLLAVAAVIGYPHMASAMVTTRVPPYDTSFSWSRIEGVASAAHSDSHRTGAIAALIDPLFGFDDAAQIVLEFASILAGVPVGSLAEAVAVIGAVADTLQLAMALDQLANLGKVKRVGVPFCFDVGPGSHLIGTGLRVHGGSFLLGTGFAVAAGRVDFIRLIH